MLGSGGVPKHTLGILLSLTCWAMILVTRWAMILVPCWAMAPGHSCWRHAGRHRVALFTAGSAFACSHTHTSTPTHTYTLTHTRAAARPPTCSNRGGSGGGVAALGHVIRPNAQRLRCQPGERQEGGGGVVACLHSFLGAHAAGASRVWRGCLVRHQFCVVHPWTKCVINTRARLHARQHVHRCVHANAYTQPCTHPHAQQTHVPPASASLAAVMRALGNLAPCCSMVPCRSKRKMTRSPCSSRCPSKPCRQLLRGRRVRSKRRSWWPSRQ